ncbi:MAG: hypothetical protein ACREJT_17000 [Myxococcota bacterium]
MGVDASCKGLGVNQNAAVTDSFLMASDTLRIMCPALSCRKILAVPANSRGKHVRCKNCGATIRVPEKAMAPVAPPAAQGAAAGGEKPEKPKAAQAA